MLGLGAMARGLASLFGFVPPSPDGAQAGSGSSGSEGDGAAADGTKANATSVMLDIPFELALTGGNTTVRAPVSFACLECGGTGQDSKVKPRECSKCHGDGTVPTKGTAAKSKDARTEACSRCGGSGHEKPPKCSHCKGAGARREVRSVTVHVPMGAVDGEVVQGTVAPLTTAERKQHPGFAHESTTVVFVQFRARPHPLFHREGADLHVRVPVSVATAALGGVMRVPLAQGGVVAVRVPPGTQPGTTIRLAGMGVRRQGVVKRGSCFVHLVVVVPHTTSSKGAQLLRQYQAEENAFGPHTAWWQRSFAEWQRAVDSSSKQASKAGTFPAPSKPAQTRVKDL